MAVASEFLTFLFTDIEGSTRLWEEHSDAMRDALTGHDEIVRAAVAEHHGHVVKTTGDGFHCAFATAHDCLRACALAQSTLESTTWPEGVRLRVRMGVHTGETENVRVAFNRTLARQRADLVVAALRAAASNPLKQCLRRRGGLRPGRGGIGRRASVRVGAAVPHGCPGRLVGSQLRRLRSRRKPLRRGGGALW
jgi:hypothetical protein